MKTKYKYIHFTEATGDNKAVGGKTSYECRNNKSNDLLALVFYYIPWKQYCFTQLEQNAIFNKGCLADIQNFIEQL